MYEELKQLQNITPEKEGSPEEVLQFLKDLNIVDIFLNVWTALRILLEIPVTVTSAERSFSELKFLKTLLRSTMVEERLSSLALLPVKNNVARELDFSQAIADSAVPRQGESRCNFDN